MGSRMHLIYIWATAIYLYSGSMISPTCVIFFSLDEVNGQVPRAVFDLIIGRYIQYLVCLYDKPKGCKNLPYAFKLWSFTGIVFLWYHVCKFVVEVHGQVQGNVSDVYGHDQGCYGIQSLVGWSIIWCVFRTQPSLLLYIIRNCTDTVDPSYPTCHFCRFTKAIDRFKWWYIFYPGRIGPSLVCR